MTTEGSDVACGGLAAAATFQHMTHENRDRLDGRRALVTGGSKGAGRAVVDRLREMGADVWASARTMPAGYDRPDRFIEADTSTAEGAETVAARIGEHGALDILVHVVGGSSTPPVASPSSPTSSGWSS